LKVCLPLKDDKDAGVCVIDPNISLTTTPLPTTSTLPTVQTTPPTSILTTNTKLSGFSSDKFEVTSSTPTQSQTTSTLPPHTIPPSQPSTPRRKECPFEGYFRDLNDPSCKKFYRCYSVGNYYQKVDEGVCAPGTVFDEKLESCQYSYLSNQPCPTANQ
jgi:hypothetical protein